LPLFEIILMCLTFVFLQVWVIYTIRYRNGFRKLKQEFNYHKRKVSVIVAAHNEAHNLVVLLTSLVNQSYPVELYEIIIADDDSTDNSCDIVREFMARFPTVRLLEVKGRERVISPKKNALTKAIAESTGEIILTTDADCLVPQRWIESMVASFQDNTAMVVGYSRTKLPNWRKASFVQKFEHMDFVAIYLAMAGSYTIGKSFAAIGQNLAYTREAFQKVGGFSKISHMLSGDDVNLMQLMRKDGMSIIFNFSPHSFVYTAPIKSWPMLLSQRTRWASNMKTQSSLNPEFFWILVFIVAFYICDITLFIMNWRLGLIFFLMKAVIEIYLFYMGFPYLKADRKIIWFYPVWQIIQPIFLTTTTILGQFNLYRWRGRAPVKIPVTER
jgi:poly-beta-1,6-N-acetyl-D-glucosamine synthase